MSKLVNNLASVVAAVNSNVVSYTTLDKYDVDKMFYVYAV